MSMSLVGHVGLGLGELGRIVLVINELWQYMDCHTGVLDNRCGF
jgi:hypothetical protein